MPQVAGAKTCRLLLLGCISIAGGCSDTPIEPAHSSTPVAEAGRQREGLAHKPSGLDGVVFLTPTSFIDDSPSGEFSPSYLDDLKVELCEIQLGECTSTLAVLSSETADPHRLRVVDTSLDPVPEEPPVYYMALWSTQGITAPMDVRVTVALDGVDLRSTDLRVVQRPQGGRSSGSIKAGSVVPIKFWMDDRWEASPPHVPLPPPAVEYLGYRLANNLRIHYFEFSNFGEYAPELFSPAPELPPCGLNENAARTWLEIYLDEVRRYGYCALTELAETIRLQVAVGSAEAIASVLGVELWDRATDRRIRTSVEIDPDLVYEESQGG